MRVLVREVYENETLLLVSTIVDLSWYTFCEQ